MKLIYFILLTILSSISCKKSDSAVKKNTKGDVVIGTFLEFDSSSITVISKVIISKIEAGKYNFEANNTIPSFNFNYDAFSTEIVGGFFGDMYYKIPNQVSNNQTLDSADMTLFNKRSLSFTLTSETGNKTWIYSGVKQ